MRGFWVSGVLAAGLMMIFNLSMAQTSAPAAVPATPAASSSAVPPAKPSAPAAVPATPKPAIPAQASPAQKPPVPASPAESPQSGGAPPPGPPPGLSPDLGARGGHGDAAAVTLDVPPRTVALLVAQGKWDDAFKTIKDTQEKVKAAVDKAGLKIVGHPVAVFTKEDDSGFTFTAMLPLAPGSTGVLANGVTIGQSPAGKAIKFQHRGAYADIDSTYDLITAFLDEKGLEAQDFFVEEYLTPLTSGEDPYLAVDIYVFLKP